MKKVVKVRTFDSGIKDGYKYWIVFFNGYCIESPYFKLNSSAIRNARQFFNKLGYEIEVKK